ncbi:hypothetical protein RJG79_08310 [Mycoplasmatota bacterium WC44]
MIEKKLEDLTIVFTDGNEVDEFNDLREFYSGFYIDALCHNISEVTNSKKINYEDILEVYMYLKRLWQVITYYICIWEESLIADFGNKYRFKSGAKKRYYHINQRERGQLYVDALVRSEYVSNDFYLNFNESFGVFRAICCNPDIRDEYTYKSLDHHIHIRNIDKLNIYRNKIIHDIYLLFDKDRKVGSRNKIYQISLNLGKLYTYLPKLHKKTFIEEIIGCSKDGGVVSKYYMLNIDLIKGYNEEKLSEPLKRKLSESLNKDQLKKLEKMKEVS